MLILFILSPLPFIKGYLWFSDKILGILCMAEFSQRFQNFIEFSVTRECTYFPARITSNLIFAITVSIRPFPLEIQHSAGRLAYSVTTREFLSLDFPPAFFTHVSQARDQDEERDTEPEDQLDDRRQRVLLDFQNSQVRVF